MSLKINTHDLEMRETVQMQWFVTAPVGATPEDVLDPVFWTHVSKRLHALDEITIVAYDGSWYGKFLITYADGADVRVRQLSIWDLDPSDTSVNVNALFSVSWGGPAQKFRVVRNADNTVVHSGCRTRNDAQKWIGERPQ